MSFSYYVYSMFLSTKLKPKPGDSVCLNHRYALAPRTVPSSCGEHLVTNE